MKRSNLVIGVLLLIILALVLYNIFSKPDNLNDHQARIDILENQISEYENAITTLTFQADSLNNVAVFLESKSDSLEQVKRKVKNIYHEIYIDINTANNVQLDSIIRSNW
jgi:peptidoglycan hydrolase CwlO-like protein